MQYLFNVVYWEERWHLQHNKLEYPRVELVDFNRVLQLVEPEGSTRSRTGGFAAREQRMRASEEIPWPIVDQSGSKYVLNVDSGLFEQTDVAEYPGRKSKPVWYVPQSTTAPLSPKSLPTQLVRTGWPQPSVRVEFPDLYFKLQNFRRFKAHDSFRDGYVRAWAVHQLEIRHPFMYQAFLTERWGFSDEERRMEYGTMHRRPGWHWWWDWPE